MCVFIETEALCVKTRQGEVLVEPVSLQLCRGQNLTILGETGSGKSLLAQAIMGALPVELCAQGRVLWEGEERDENQRRALWGKHLTMLPQEPSQSLDPTMNIFNQICETLYFVGGETKSAARQKTQEKLTALGLQSFGAYYPHQLSGGMAQRVAFAVAFSGGALTVIADEPTKGLDEKNKQIVIRQLQQISQQGGALLTITHDIDVAKQLGGEIMVMKKGRLLEQGCAQNLLTAPSSDYARQLIAAAPANWLPQPKAKLMTPLLCKAEQLSLARGKRTLFSDVNFSLHQGEVLGLVGDSGIGKSSLGDALCGLLKPKCGQISWQIKTKRHQVLKLYQDPPSAFAPHIPLQTLLNDVIERHNLDRSKLPYLLEQLKLSPELLQRSAENVSGGELQRVAILRALLFEPVLLFADEVTSRLDPITQKETLDLLTEQCRQYRCALVIVSHDLDLIRHYCHQIIDLAQFSEAI
ncbi:ABC transporter ATP-binding protein [Caviibacterium pharyngocola]|uniref:ABC transporter ATP-binding protein n=1 Tax=Caviibacterium pharyngocola TaxID=28159 RepID=A0A2M8RXT1_9PAST|nr:ATP-binding cassette domain-containing protein [Caviibacterium pharyngocola]PJG83697.1 ABC transporter ATP-binding protein [Caviibacterium pharyngocola]